MCRPPMSPLPQHHVSVSFSGIRKGMQRAAASLLEGMLGDAHQRAVARDIASLPMRKGRARDPISVAVATPFWASWADALPVLEKRLPPTCSTSHHNPGGRTGGRLFG